jgi:UDP-N-acetylmuramate: L-alanyl-gamma-D-glutamyl-meso-diaminopimelate ligase
MTRGVPVIEALLDRGLPYASGPEWLAREVLKDRWVIAIAGTHGKTTTTSLTTWILEHAGLSPGFLIGGVPANFNTSARLGMAPFFVIEADEYDTAFFDKRAKFVHYRPRTLVLNNLEFDHADIYPDVAAIQRQFHHLVRTVPGAGSIIWNAGDERLAQTLKMGCWTPLQGFSASPSVPARWQAAAAGAADYSRFEVLENGVARGTVEWDLMGAHNVANALAAIAAAHHAGVPVTTAIEALRSFKGIARRMQLRGAVHGIRVYDDFAHHPTAIATTVDGLRRRVGTGRILAVLEMRSNTMRMGVHNELIAPALAAADEVFLFTPPDLGWDTAPLLHALGARGHAVAAVDAMALAVADAAAAGDSVLVMSNGGFGGLHEKLLAALDQRFAHDAADRP